MEDPPANKFYGLSSLRAKEKAELPKTAQAKAMEEYLKRYTDGAADGPKKKKRKKAPATLNTRPVSNVRIVDEDMSGFKIAQLKRKLPPKFDDDAADGNGEDSDGPVIANPGEAELYKRQQAQERSGAALANWSTANEDNIDDPDALPPRRKPRHDTPDASPPRRKARHDTPDASPPRRKAQQEAPDASPPRRKPRHDSPDASPPRRQPRKDSPDASPPRRRVRHNSPDASPPRRPQRNDSADASPPRRRPRHDSPDASPPRRKARAQSPDASPPRRPKPASLEASKADRDGGKKHGRMADGTATGMISAKDLSHEIALKRKAEQERFNKLERKLGSKYAETVYRDKQTGRTLTKEDFEEKERLAAEKKRAKYETPEWGGGLRQKQEREEQQKEMQRQADKPFARNLNDVDEDLNLEDRVRFGDPMAHLVKRRDDAPLPPAVPAHMAKLLKKGGFAIPQEVPSHSWLKRRMGPPPNRYGIKPGRHWDGVDRSNGFERDMFKTIAARAAEDREARAWAQSDM